MSIAAGLIGVAGALGAAGLSYGLTQMSNKKQLQYQKDFFNYTNEYNLPFQQRERLLQGGYNPNLAYGGVNQVAGASMPSVGAAPRYQFDKDLFGLQLTSQIRQTEAQTRLTEAQEWHQHLENRKLEAGEEFWKDNESFASEVKKWLSYSAQDEYNITRNKRLESDIRYFALTGDSDRNIGNFEDYIRAGDSPLYQSLIGELEAKGLSGDLAQARIDKLVQDVSESAARIVYMAKQGYNLDVRSELLELEKDMKQSLGVSYNDNLGMRMIAIMLSAIGVDPRNLDLYPEKLEPFLGKGVPYPSPNRGSAKFH